MTERWVGVEPEVGALPEPEAPVLGGAGGGAAAATWTPATGEVPWWAPASQLVINAAAPATATAAPVSSLTRRTSRRGCGPWAPAPGAGWCGRGPSTPAARTGRRHAPSGGAPGRPGPRRRRRHGRRARAATTRAPEARGAGGGGGLRGG